MATHINRDVQYYIVSLAHTMRHENYITLWRPDNAGYCYSSQHAGVYKGYEEGYHDGESSMPLPVSIADGLFLEIFYCGETKNMIPNCKAIWDVLGVRMTKDGLVRKRKP